MSAEDLIDSLLEAKPKLDVVQRRGKAPKRPKQAKAPRKIDLETLKVELDVERARYVRTSGSHHFFVGRGFPGWDDHEARRIAEFVRNKYGVPARHAKSDGRWGIVVTL